MRGALLAGILIVAAAVANTPTSAQVPKYDVEQHCRQTSGLGGTYGEMVFANCMDMEKGAYDELKQKWASLNEGVQDRCEEIATFGGPGSYSLLKSCVQREEAADSNENSVNH